MKHDPECSTGIVITNNMQSIITELVPGENHTTESAHQSVLSVSGGSMLRLHLNLRQKVERKREVLKLEQDKEQVAKDLLEVHPWRSRVAIIRDICAACAYLHRYQLERQ